ncbi:MAG TPA: DUF1800 family protein, partial [Miltoncostaeaceae bacterium]|nr:DUF1800 family protein [Miltoncostaeaceae bacterium]
AGGAQAALTEPMVDRLMWRAGFGPSEADRQRFKGMSLHRAVDRLLADPRGPAVGPPPRRRDGTPLRPYESDTDLVLSWCDEMIRTRNPLVERLVFFFHRHFATQRIEVSPPQLMTQQTALFRKYADLGSNRISDFRNLLYEVGEGPAMLRFLTGEDSRKGRINENYGRELLELFGLGVTNAAGQPNYTEADVLAAARASTGWQVNDDDPDNPAAYFTSSRWDEAAKTVLGQTGAFNHRQLVDVVLAHPSHAPFLVTKLWGEFIPTPPDAATLRDLVRIYTGSRLRLRPLVRRILTHPAMLASIKEPTMIKPPVVVAIGTMRALGLGITDDTLYTVLNDMGQLPYFPPTVAGWEGGASWLNTNTALARFSAANRLLSLKYATLATKAPEDESAETPKQAFARAHASVGRPWVGRGTKSSLLYYATKARNTSSNDRIARQRVLRAFLLGGPDAQVM